MLDKWQQLTDHGKHSEAIAILDKFVAHNNVNARAYRTRGNALARLGKMPEALADYNRALEIAPSDEGTHLLRGEVYVLTGRSKEALADEDFVLKNRSSPNRSRALFLKSHALFGLHQYDEALDCADQSVKIRGAANFHDHMIKSFISRQSKRPKAALLEVNAAIQSAPKDFSGYLERASCYSMTKDTKAMIRDCDRAISLDPKRAQSYLLSASLCETTGVASKEMEYLTGALRLVPKDVDARMMLAELMERQGKFDDVVLQVEKVLALVPDHERAIYLRGYSKFQKQDYKGSLKDAQKVLSLNPRSQDGLYLAHTSNFKIGNFDEALKLIDRRIAVAPTSRGDAIAHKAIIYNAMGKYDQALEVMKNSEKHQCSPKEICLQRVYAYNRLQRPGKANSEFLRAIRALPNDASLLLEYAIFKWRTNREDPEIVAVCDRTIRADPKALHAYIIKGSCLVHMRKPLEALSPIENALSLDNKCGAAYQVKGKAYKQLHRPLEETIAILKKGRELGADDVDCSYHIVDLMINQGHADKGLVEVDAAIARNPESAPLHRMRGLCLSKLGKPQAALLSAEKSEQLQPASVKNLLSIKLLEASGSYQKAISELTVLIKAAPDDATLLVDRASCYRKQKKTTEALIDLTRAIKLDPFSYAAHFERAGLYKDLLRIDRALADAREALALDSAAIGPRFVIAEILFEKKMFREVVEQLSVFLEHRPHHVEALLLRGKAYSQLDSSDLALKDYERVFKRVPNHLGARRARMSEFLRLKKYSQVIEESDFVIPLDRKNFRVFETRAEAEEQLGRLREAVDDYTKAIEITAQVGALYQRRAELYEKLGHPDLAKLDRKKLEEYEFVNVK
ncbi:MAG: tetratricopeptide repeat protein [Candidatus Obscuribacterales bacterium]|nr:tetratricopeptide repeat protein [Candidatus Obscuribacterales bacterium]